MHNKKGKSLFFMFIGFFQAKSSKSVKKYFKKFKLQKLIKRKCCIYSKSKAIPLAS